MKDTSFVCRNFNVSNQAWVRPETDGVVGKATGAGDLSVVRAPAQAGDLRACVDAVDACTGRSVPAAFS